MKHIRIIPRLDIKGPNLVKGIHLEGLRVLGKPEEFARVYYEQGADELIYQDTVASLYQRNSLTDIITKTAANIFIPITVGGGLRTLDDINKVLRAGADKVAINTAGIQNPDFITQASRAFGSSTIVVAIETIKQSKNSYLAYTDNGREFTGINSISWAKQVEDLGAGEILLTSIDQEGTGGGFDFDIIKQITDVVSIPVIAHGGAATIPHISHAITKAGADAIAIASMLHYASLNTNNEVLNNYDDEGNIEFLKDKRSFKMFGEGNLSEIKAKLKKTDIPLRTLN